MVSNGYTPWGTCQDIEQIGPGVEFVYTASHGGFHLSPDALARVPESVRLSTFKQLGTGGWFEEDCDAHIVVAYFPEHFPASVVEESRTMLTYYNAAACSALGLTYAGRGVN